MIVKVEVRGDAALLTTRPGEGHPIRLVVPASRVRPRFAEARGDVEGFLAQGGSFVGYFAAREATTRNVATNEDVPLDVLELGDRLPEPKEGW